MMQKYSALSDHLNGELLKKYEVNEGLFDVFKKKSKEKEGKAKLLGGFLGSLFSFIPGVGGDKKEDKLTKAYKDIAAKEAEREKKRLEDEANAEEDLEVSKLWAKSEAEQRNLDLKSQAKVARYGARKKQIDAYTEQIKTNDLIQPDENIAAIIDEIDKMGNDNDGLEDSPLTQMKDLAMQIVCDETGKPRTQEEINKKMEEDPEFKAIVEEYNGMAKKHQQDLITGMNEEDFKKAFGHLQGNIRTEQELAKEEELIANEEKRLKERQEVYKIYKDAEKSHKDAQAKVIAKEEELNTLKNDPFISDNVDNDGNVSPMRPEAFRGELKSAISGLDFIKTENGSASLDEDLVAQKLEELGIPSEQISKIKDKMKSDLEANPSLTSFDDALSDLTDDDINKAAKAVADKQTEKVKGKMSEIDSAKTAAENYPDPNTEEGMKKIKQSASGDDKEKWSRFEELQSMGEGDSEEAKKIKEELTSGMYDPESEAGKAAQDQINTAKEKNKTEREQHEKQKEANRKRRESSLQKIKNRKENSLPPELEKEIEKQLSGIEAGEEKNEKGQVGFYIGTGDKKEWVPKPGPKATKKEQEEYKAKRATKILTMSIDDDSESLNIGEVKKNEDGTYTIKDKDGNVINDKADNKEVVIAIANKRQHRNQKEDLIVAKQELADKLKSCIKNGKFDPKTFNGLTPSQKAAIETIVNDKDGFEKYFKGIDIAGAELEKIENVFGGKAAKEEIANAVNDEARENDYKNRDKENDGTENDEWEDVNDEDEDANDENDYNEETDDENNGKANGEDVKKVNGKWYKVSDLDSDGNPTENAQEVSANDVTQNKKTKSLKNPAKEWHRKKKKNGKGMTKSYYNKDGESISSDDYKAKMERYKAAKHKNESVKYSNLRNYLLEKINK